MTECTCAHPLPLYGDIARRWQARKERSHKKPSMLAPWSWALQPAEAWEISVCGFTHPVWDILLQQPALTHTDTLGAHLHYRYVQRLALARSSYSFKDLKKKQKAKIYWVVLFLSSSPSPFLGISSFWQSTEFELKEMQHVSKFCVTWLQNQPSWLRTEALTPSKAVWLTYLFAYRAKMERKKKKSRKRSESAQTPFWSWISREPEMRVLMHIPWAYHDYYF